MTTRPGARALSISIGVVVLLPSCLCDRRGHDMSICVLNSGATPQRSSAEDCEAGDTGACQSACFVTQTKGPERASACRRACAAESWMSCRMFGEMVQAGTAGAPPSSSAALPFFDAACAHGDEVGCDEARLVRAEGSLRDLERQVQRRRSGPASN